MTLNGAPLPNCMRIYRNNETKSLGQDYMAQEPYIPRMRQKSPVSFSSFSFSLILNYAKIWTSFLCSVDKDGEAGSSRGIEHALGGRRQKFAVGLQVCSPIDFVWPSSLTSFRESSSELRNSLEWVLRDLLYTSHTAKLWSPIPAENVRHDYGVHLLPLAQAPPELQPCASSCLPGVCTINRSMVEQYIHHLLLQISCNPFSGRWIHAWNTRQHQHLWLWHTSSTPNLFSSTPFSGS